MPELQFIFSIIVLVFSVIAHEVAHGYVADYLGDPTARLSGRLTLNPVPHVDAVGSLLVPVVSYLAGGFIFGWAKPVPYNPYNLRGERWGTLAVASAGVLVNFIIAIVFGLVVRFGPELGIVSSAFLSIAGTIVFLNVLLGIFNLIPLPPLDGSKVLFSLLPARFYHFERVLERYSLILLVLLIFFGWRFISPLLFFIFSLLTGVETGTLGL